jgi:hypothetical protein
MDSEIKFTIAPIEQMAAAMENARVNVQRFLAPLQVGFDRYAAFAKMVSDSQASMQRTIERWTRQNQLNFSRMAEIMAIAAANFERYRNEEEPEACRLLSQAGWLGMDRHFCMEHLRESVLLHKTQGESAMNDAIRDYFNENDAALLVAMSEAWLSIPYLCDREQIIRDAVDAHKQGKFTLSIPALMPLAEGLAAEVRGDISTRAVQKLAAEWKSREAEVWAQEFYEAVEQVIYKFYLFGKDPAPYLNRHGILHGRVVHYATAANSTRVFLLIDAIAELWHEKQKALAPATIQ